MSLNDFHKLNIQRQHEAFAPPHPLMALVVCVQEEVGDLEKLLGDTFNMVSERAGSKLFTTLGKAVTP